MTWLLSVRRLWLCIAVCAACWTGNAPKASAQSEPSSLIGDNQGIAADLDQLLEKRGDVSFRQTPLSEAIFSLSSVWGVNIVAGKEVEGQVSGSFTNAPLAEVLDAILSANGFGYRRSGQSLVILPQASIGADDPHLVSRTIHLPNNQVDQEAVLSAAKLLLSQKGQLQAVPEHGSVLVIDTADRIQRVESFFAELQPTTMGETRGTPSTAGAAVTAAPANAQPTVRYFTPQFIKADQLTQPLQAVLGESVRMSIMTDENRLLVMGTAEQLQLASDVVCALDQPRPQVRIAALIYDVELRQGEELGIDWGRTLSINGSFGGAEVTADAAGGAAAGGAAGGAGGAVDGAATAAVTGLAITLGTLQDTLSVNNVIKALDETRGAHLLADPTITVSDRNEASIKIVTKIPFQQLTQTQQGGNIGTTAFEEAGIILTVTPSIASDGTIQMKVRPEFSTLVEYVNGQPLIDQRTAETNVRIADRHTLVIGGLRRKQMRDAITGIPGLKDIRKIGRLFGAHDSSLSESELIVFLRPEIITPYSLLRPREYAAADVSNYHLNQIPVADYCPMVPDCKDCHCVYHHRRPAINPGMNSGADFGNGLIGGYGIEQPVDQSAPLQIELSNPAVIQEAETEYPPPVHVAPVTARLRKATRR